MYHTLTALQHASVADRYYTCENFVRPADDFVNMNIVRNREKVPHPSIGEDCHIMHYGWLSWFWERQECIPFPRNLCPGVVVTGAAAPSHQKNVYFGTKTEYFRALALQFRGNIHIMMKEWRIMRENFQASMFHLPVTCLHIRLGLLLWILNVTNPVDMPKHKMT